MGPYDGLKVVELGRFIAAPYCGQLLADGGADVVKIEPLLGDDARHNGTRLSATEARQFLNKNRGKRSVAVDLKDARVRQTVVRLAVEADVILANFRPGQAESLGLGYEAIHAQNPRVVYAENTGFGKVGPMADKPGMDVLLQAYAGIATPERGGPKMNPDPIIDYTAGLLLAWGIATALYVRERSGQGQRLDVSLLQAALVIQNNSVNHIDAVDGWRHDFVDYLKDAFAEGATLDDVLDQREVLKPNVQPPYYGLFPTGQGFLAIAAGGLGLRKKVAELLEIDDPGIADVNFQPEDVMAYTQEVRNQVIKALASKSAAEWQARFEQAGVPAGVVNFKDQILDDEQAWANEYLVRLEHEEVGGMTVVAPPVKFDETPLSVRGPTPRLGQHTREVLGEAGLSAQEIQALVDEGKVSVVGT